MVSNYKGRQRKTAAMDDVMQEFNFTVNNVLPEMDHVTRPKAIASQLLEEITIFEERRAPE